MLLKKRKLRQKTVSNNGVAFENPSYLREIHMDRVQVHYLYKIIKNDKIIIYPLVQITPITVPTSSVNSNHNNSNNNISNGSSSNNNDWRHEELTTPSSQIPAETEVNPTLIEELKLGSSNAGFRKLVS